MPRLTREFIGRVIKMITFLTSGDDEMTLVFPKIRGKPPKWMVKIRENPIKIDVFGGKKPIFGNTHICFFSMFCHVSIFLNLPLCELKGVYGLFRLLTFW